MKSRKAPYADTEVPPEKSKDKITQLLRDYGAEAVSWSEIFSRNSAEIRFILKTPEGRMVQVKIVPPAFSVPRRTWVAEEGRYEIRPLPNWAQSYRLLYYFLKAKLESIAFGLRDVEEEFLSDMVVTSAEGRETTVGEALRPSLEAGTFRPALPAPRKERDTVDATYTEAEP